MDIILPILGAIAALVAIVAGIIEILAFFEKKRGGSSLKSRPLLKKPRKPKIIVVNSTPLTSPEKDNKGNSFVGLNKLVSKDLVQLMQTAEIQALAIDDCVLISGSQDFKGWSANEIKVAFQENETEIPYSLKDVINTYRDSIVTHFGDTQSYRVVSVSPWLTDRPIVHITLAPIFFRDYFVIRSLLDKPILKTSTGKLKTIRQEYGSSGLNYAESSHPIIPTNVSIQPIIVSGDDKVLLAQRSNHVLYYPGAWSASLEETMKGTHKTSDSEFVKDNDFIEGVIRGIQEELGSEIKIDPNEIKVLSFCVEYPTLSFDVLCVAKVLTAADKIIESWLLTAPDKFEANRLEAVPLQFDALINLFLENRYWHPTSRMRLLQLMIQNYGIDKTISAIHT